jgi:hypothetical protein
MQIQKLNWVSGVFVLAGFMTACSGGDVTPIPGTLLSWSNSAGSIALGKAPTDVKCGQIELGINGNLNGFVPFPRDNPWNLVIAGVPANPNSSSLISNYVNRVGVNPAMHGDFSADGGGDRYTVVDSSIEPLQVMSIDQYPGESDIMPVPLANSAYVQGGNQNCSEGDCHLFLLDRSQCWLYETYQTHYDGNLWHVSNVAVWDMLNTSKRPYGWTSADAAGLSVFSGMIRYDEVVQGSIDHAIRFTLSHTGNSFVAPATHAAGYDTTAFPMGTRFRLKPGFELSGFNSHDQVILAAMKNYGLILADTGTDLEVAGINDPRWPIADVMGLKNLHLTDFEVLSGGSVMSRSNLPTGALPRIQSFRASSQTIASGQSVTLSFDIANASWNFIDMLGPVRGQSVTISPTATTTYTLNSTNEFGRTTESVTVEVHP